MRSVAQQVVTADTEPQPVSGRKREADATGESHPRERPDFESTFNFTLKKTVQHKVSRSLNEIRLLMKRGF
jgi:hypothetical protein